MFENHHPACCLGCPHRINRRGFLKGCGALTAAGGLAPLAGLAAEAGEPQARVALVFLSNSEEREIWPYPGFDCARRQAEIAGMLEKAVPQVKFEPILVAGPMTHKKPSQ